MEKTLEELFLDKDLTSIVSRFEKFLGRYKEIFNPRSSTNKILGLKKYNDIYRTLRYLTHSGSSTEIHQMRTSIIESFGEEDMYQIIYLAFLETVNKFDPSRNVPLQKFIYNYYPYVLTSEVIKVAGPKQILNLRYVPRENSEQDEWAEENILNNNYKLIEALSYTELDYKWIDGETCGEPFSCLTPLERKLLIMIYIDKSTHEEIAQDMRYHFSSIKRKKNEILIKLTERMKSMEEEDGYRLYNTQL